MTQEEKLLIVNQNNNTQQGNQDRSHMLTGTRDFPQFNGH